MIALEVDADSDVRRLVAHMGAVADLHHDRVEVDDRIERLERPTLPCQDLVEDFVGDLADRLVRQLGPDRRREMVLDVANRHAAGVEADDHLVEPAETPSALRHQPRREGPVTVPRRGQVDLTDLGPDRLRCETVPRVREQRRVGIALLIAQVIRQLDLQAALERSLDQLRDHPSRARHLQLASIDPREQVIQRTRRDQRLNSIRSRPGHLRVAHKVHPDSSQPDRPLHRRSDTSEHLGVTSVGLRASDVVWVAITGDRERVDRIHLIAGRDQRLYPQATIGLDSDHHLCGVVSVIGDGAEAPRVW